MLEDIIKKREIVNKIAEELKEAAETGDLEKMKELMDRAYVASFEQSMALSNEINFIKDSLNKKDLAEDSRKYLNEMAEGLQNVYHFSSMQLRLIAIAGQKYGLTNAPEG